MKSFAYTLAVLFGVLSFAHADDAAPAEVVVEEAAVEEVPAAAAPTAEAETPADNQ